MLNSTSEQHDGREISPDTMTQQVSSAPTPDCSYRTIGIVPVTQLSASAPVSLTTSAVTTPSKDRPSKPDADSVNYDRETILTFLSQMKQAGYGDRKQQKKSLKEVFTKATELAKKENGINRSAKAWQKKCTRMKQEYSAYIAKISQSGQRGGGAE